MQWQPIETAPKDGTAILAFIPDAYDPVDVVRWEKNSYLGDGWYHARCVDGGKVYDEVSHWMPLPEAPM